MLKKPIFITNFKNYETATGQAAVDLAKLHEKVAHKLGVSVAVAVTPLDLHRVSSQVSIPVLCQGLDLGDYGSFTGKVLAANVRKNGGVGTVLNHSENRLKSEDVLNVLACAQKASLVRVLCAESPEEIESLSPLDPDFLAFEPPELIGSSTASVASHKPDSIVQAVAKSGGLPVLVGAGISSAEDIKVSLELGARGFLVASSICKADDPEKVLTELLSVMKN